MLLGTPPGAISAYAGVAAPSGWLLCDGQAVSRTTHAGLFAAISTLHGAGDGSTTFNVPNLKGRVAVHLDAAQTEFDLLGEAGGAKTHTLTEAQLPAHDHPFHDAAGVQQTVPHTSGVASENTIGGAGGNRVPVTGPGPPNLPWTYPLDTGDAGGGGAHNNLPPYLVLNHIIKT